MEYVAPYLSATEGNSDMVGISKTLSIILSQLIPSRWRRTKVLPVASNVCVDKEFLSCAKKVQKRFVVVSEADPTLYICKHCRAESKMIRCKRPVFARTVNGVQRAVASWDVPVCPNCDSKEPSISLTNPILVTDGFSLDGWRKLGEFVSRFLHFKVQKITTP